MFHRITSKFLAAAFALAALFVIPSSANAGLMTSLDALDQAQIFATDPRFQSVGYVSGFDNLGEYFIGSGVLIDPYWVLTAGHNLLDSGTTQISGAGFSLNTNFFDVPTNLSMADALYPFPGYSANTTPGEGSDIGLFHLVDPIFDVVPANRFHGTDQQSGTHVYTVGYGTPGVFPREFDFDGIKRAGENVVDCIGCFSLGPANNNYFLAEYSEFAPLPLEWQSAPGDSGGAWFTDIDGQLQLIGINDFTRGFDVSGAIRVSLFNDWIDETIANHTTVPEPSSLVLFGLGMLGLGCGRSRKQPAA